MNNNKDSTIDFDSIVQKAMNNVSSENVVQTTIQNNFMEMQQTNVIKVESKVESIAIDTKSINKIYDICNEMKSSDRSLGELLLGISTLFAGAFFGALISSVPYIFGWRSILFYGLSPIVAVSCFVAFLFLRNNEVLSKKEYAEHILEYLPKAPLIERGTHNEH